jgi:hypothetical protein
MAVGETFGTLEPEVAGFLDRFVYLKVGLAALLVFAGVKILASSIYPIPIAVSLGVIVLILTIAIVASLVATHPARGRLAGGIPWAAVPSRPAVARAGLTLGAAMLLVLALFISLD